MRKILLKSETYPLNVTINKEEMKSLRPDAIPRTSNVFFGKTGVAEVDWDIGLFIDRRLSCISVINRKGEKIKTDDEISKMQWTEMRDLAKEYNVNTFGIGRDKLHDELRVAMSEEA